MMRHVSCSASVVQCQVQKLELEQRPEQQLARALELTRPAAAAATAAAPAARAAPALPAPLPASAPQSGAAPRPPGLPRCQTRASHLAGSSGRLAGKRGKQCRGGGADDDERRSDAWDSSCECGMQANTAPRSQNAACRMRQQRRLAPLLHSPARLPATMSSFALSPIMHSSAGSTPHRSAMCSSAAGFGL